MQEHRGISPNPPLLPGLARWRQLSAADKAGDVIAGLVTAALLVPQGMAYAALAGLPPQMGLYSALLPLLVYALVGSSRVIAMGPMALSALLVGDVLHSTGAPVSQLPALAGTLGLLVGGWLLLCYFLRLGRLIDFISPSVMQGFTAASALMIILSQISILLGLHGVGSNGNFFQQVFALSQHVRSIQFVHVVWGVAAFLFLVAVKHGLKPLLIMLRMPVALASVLGRCGPLLLIISALVVVAVWVLPLDRVGRIPAGLPPAAFPNLDIHVLMQLAVPALGIALINYVSAISVAETLAARQREQVFAQRELWVLGVCNLCAAFTRGFPVTSGLGRAAVNVDAGSRSPLSSLFAALALAVVLLCATSLFAPLPTAVLAAVVMQAATPLVDFSSAINAWRFSRADACAWVGAFTGVLIFGVIDGLAIGVGITLALLLARASRPYIDEIGRLPEGGFRNPARYPVDIPQHLMMVRPGADLNFSNMGALERFINQHLTQRHQVADLVLVMSGVLYIDGAALDALDRLDQRLSQQGITLWLAEIRAPVRDQLKSTDFLATHRDRVFFSAEEAWQRLAVNHNEPEFMI